MKSVQMKILDQILGAKIWLNSAVFLCVESITIGLRLRGLQITFTSVFYNNLPYLIYILCFCSVFFILFFCLIFYKSSFTTTIRVLANIFIFIFGIVFLVMWFVYLEYIVAKETVFLMFPELGIAFCKTDWSFGELFVILGEHLCRSGKFVLSFSDILRLVNSNVSPEGLIQAYDTTVELELLSREMAKVRVPAANYGDWLLYQVGIISASMVIFSVMWLFIKVYNLTIILDATILVQDDQSIAINSLSAESMRLAGAQSKMAHDVQTIGETMGLLTEFLRSRAAAASTAVS
jgi:hypothetical protein